jgi:hypothetical protein
MWSGQRFVKRLEMNYRFKSPETSRAQVKLASGRSRSSEESVSARALGLGKRCISGLVNLQPGNQGGR